MEDVDIVANGAKLVTDEKREYFNNKDLVADTARNMMINKILKLAKANCDLASDSCKRTGARSKSLSALQESSGRMCRCANAEERVLENCRRVKDGKRSDVLVAKVIEWKPEMTLKRHMQFR